MTKEWTRSFLVRKGTQLSDAVVHELARKALGDVEIVRWSVDPDPVRYDAYEGWMVEDKEHDEVRVVYMERGS